MSRGREHLVDLEGTEQIYLVIRDHSALINLNLSLDAFHFISKNFSDSNPLNWKLELRIQFIYKIVSFLHLN